jgi:thiosulfate/3-mercaptopyruvate sulfurtransferase
MRLTSRFTVLVPALLAVVLMATMTVSAALAASPLVSSTWVRDHLGKDGIVMLDLQGQRGYARAHVPGSVSTDYGQWRTMAASGTRAMLPPPAYLEKLAGALGISNDTHVVLLPVGFSAGDMAVATRIYWTFKAMGHDNVSLLQGGLVDYAMKKKFPLSNQPVTPAAATFKAHPVNGFDAGSAGVLNAIENGIQIVDARSADEYRGKRYGRGERPGTIPTAKLLTYSDLTEPKSGAFLPVAELKARFMAAGIDPARPLVTFCHTGHRASLSWFVAHELLGNTEARLYDGSMAEWAKDKKLPMVIGK